ncbi:elongation factor 1-delta-like [Actinidia eriantha]|uniref:elongation factor 1-delta-like n=1 Tax=Actinidia eriantha TaxID=165200 RepID=UPI002585AB9A|nr:elongation factor 1-delta-like [Actinidia eriantha]
MQRTRASVAAAKSTEYVNVSWCGISGEGCGVTIESSVADEAAVATPPAADTKVGWFHSTCFHKRYCHKINGSITIFK